MNKLTIAVGILVSLFAAFFIYDNNVDVDLQARGQMMFMQSLSNHSLHFGGATIGKINIGIVYPTFTAAAYNNSFYKFYSIYGISGTLPLTNVTTNLNLLTSKVTDVPVAYLQEHNIVTNQTSGLFYLSTYLRLLIPRANINNLADPDVDNGSIFMRDGANKYNILIIGHQEYVTQKEYDNLRHFVANGGTLIILDGNVFYVQVKYDRNTKTITLVKGHSWAFNGKSAWRSVNERWYEETSQWIGSNSYNAPIIKFTNSPFSYAHFEEQYITNPNAKIIMNTGAVAQYNFRYPKPVIATYQMEYQGGKVIVFGIYAERVITSDNFLKFFKTVLLNHALIGLKTTAIGNISSNLVSNAVSSSIASEHKDLIAPSVMPRAIASNLICSRGWHIEGYFTPVETDYQNKTTDVIKIGNVSRSFYGPFLDSVNYWGWGKTKNGDYISYYNGIYSVSAHPLDATGNRLQIGDVSTSPSQIPTGTKYIVIPTLPPPWDTKAYTASDIISQPERKEIDVYTGEGKLAGTDAVRINTGNNNVCLPVLLHQ